MLFYICKSNDFFWVGVIALVILQIQAQDIHVGNIVWLRENDEVPCDLVLIGTSDPQGVCYIEVIMSWNMLKLVFSLCSIAGKLECLYYSSLSLSLTFHYIHFKDLMIWHVIQTAALDGETDLKTRVIPSACMGIDVDLLHKIKARSFLKYLCLVEI